MQLNFQMPHAEAGSVHTDSEHVSLFHSSELTATLLTDIAAFSWDRNDTARTLLPANAPRGSGTNYPPFNGFRAILRHLAPPATPPR